MLLFLFVTEYAVDAWGHAYRANHPMSKEMFYTWFLPVVILDLLALALAAIQTRQGRLTAGALGLRREELSVQVSWGVAGAVLGLLAVFLWSYLRVALTAVLRRAGLLGPEWSWYVGKGFGDIVAGFSVGTVLTGMAVVVFAEEAAFRGIILPRLRRITGHWWSAVLICSLLFGFYHRSGGLGLVFVTTFISVPFCIVFIRSRSLVASSVAHFLYNMTLYEITKGLPAMGLVRT